MKKIKGKFIPRLICCAWLGAVLATQTRAGPLDHWTWRFPDPQGNYLNGITFGAGRFVAIGYSGTIITSANCTNWVVRDSPSTNHLHGLTCSGNQYVAVGKGGTIFTSPTGSDC